MSELSRDDVLKILELIDKSPFDFFELKMGDLKVTVSKTGPIAQNVSVAPAPAAASIATPQPAPAPAAVGASVAAQPGSPGQQQRTAVVVPEGMVPVKAPMVGTFYAQPEPGAPPYVALGSSVDEDTTLALVEVMKVFNAVRAGARGTIAEILVQNAQFVEFGQILFLIKPDEPTTNGASA